MKKKLNIGSGIRCGGFHGGEQTDTLPGGGFHGGEQTDTLPGGGFHGGEQTDTLPGGGFHGTRFMTAEELRNCGYSEADIRGIQMGELPIPTVHDSRSRNGIDICYQAADTFFAFEE